MSGFGLSKEAQRAAADRRRFSRRMLQDMREDTWGWVVYRTTYGHGSDPAFHKAVEILKSWIKDGVYREIRDSEVENADPTPNNQLWERFKLTVMEDAATLDGASLDAVRAHFEAWGEGLGKRDRWVKYRVCLVLDEAAVQRLSKAMTPEEHLEQHGPECIEEAPQWFLPVVEAFQEPDMGDPDYEGWMNCSVYAFMELWMSMGDGSYMAYAFEAIYEGVYW